MERRILLRMCLALVAALGTGILGIGCSEGGGTESCVERADCGDGRLCLGRQCVDICETRADCAEPLVCLDGACVPGAECASRSDCLSNEACEEGVCVPQRDECSLDSECPPRHECDAGACVLLAEEISSSSGSDLPSLSSSSARVSDDTSSDRCVLNSDCSEGERCEESRCVAIERSTPGTSGTVPSDSETSFDEETSVESSTSFEGCVEDGECEEGELCVEGECLEGSCKTSSECDEGFFCNDALNCEREPECDEDTPCSSGEKCEDGVCVFDPECEAKEDCDEGFDCIDFRCEFNPECETREDCDGGRVCREDTCTTCNFNSECYENEICSELGRCEEIQPDCVEDRDCESDEECIEGECIWTPECEIDADCPADQECFAGVCECPGAGTRGYGQSCSSGTQCCSGICPGGQTGGRCSRTCGNNAECADESDRTYFCGTAGGVTEPGVDVCVEAVSPFFGQQSCPNLVVCPGGCLTSLTGSLTFCSYTCQTSDECREDATCAPMAQSGTPVCMPYISGCMGNSDCFGGECWNFQVPDFPQNICTMNCDPDQGRTCGNDFVCVDPGDGGQPICAPPSAVD